MIKVEGDKINEEEKKITRFVQLSLNMMLRGFDEMEMQKRLELVDLLGFTIQHSLFNNYTKVNDLEKRIQVLEKNNKLEINHKKK